MLQAQADHSVQRVEQASREDSLLLVFLSVRSDDRRREVAADLVLLRPRVLPGLLELCCFLLEVLECGVL